jgi:hypothetical protein
MFSYKIESKKKEDNLMKFLSHFVFITVLFFAGKAFSETQYSFSDKLQTSLQDCIPYSEVVMQDSGEKATGVMNALTNSNLKTLPVTSVFTINGKQNDLCSIVIKEKGLSEVTISCHLDQELKSKILQAMKADQSVIENKTIHMENEYGHTNISASGTSWTNMMTELTNNSERCTFELDNSRLRKQLQQ